MKRVVKVAALIVVGGVGYGWYEFNTFNTEVVPQLNAERSAQEAVLRKKESELKQLQDFSANIDKVKEELRELSLQLETALEHMPKSFNLSALLRRFTELGQSSGLDVATFRPGKEEAKKEGAFYTSIVVDMELQGTFTQTLLFLDQISRMKRIVNVDQLKFSVVETQPVGSGIMTRTIASVKTFRFAE